MKAYNAKTLAGTSRYRDYFPTLPVDVQADACARIGKLQGDKRRAS